MKKLSPINMNMGFIDFNKAMAVANAVLIIGMVLLTLQWAENYFQTQETSSSASKTAKVTKVSSSIKAKTNHLKLILSAHLFGKPTLKNSVDPSKVSKSTQNLKLEGILFFPQQPKRSQALISVSGKTAESYRLGDKLKQAQGKIYAILRESVQIERQGKLEKVELSKL